MFQHGRPCVDTSVCVRVRVCDPCDQGDAVSQCVVYQLSRLQQRLSQHFSLVPRVWLPTHLQTTHLHHYTPTDNTFTSLHTYRQHIYITTHITFNTFTSLHTYRQHIYITTHIQHTYPTTQYTPVHTTYVPHYTCTSPHICTQHMCLTTHLHAQLISHYTSAHATHKPPYTHADTTHVPHYIPAQTFSSPTHVPQDTPAQTNMTTSRHTCTQHMYLTIHMYITRVPHYMCTHHHIICETLALI